MKSQHRFFIFIPSLLVKHSLREKEYFNMREEELYQKTKLWNISYSIPLNLNLMKTCFSWLRESNPVTAGELSNEPENFLVSGRQSCHIGMMVLCVRMSETYVGGKGNESMSRLSQPLSFVMASNLRPCCLKTIGDSQWPSPYWGMRLSGSWVGKMKNSHF